MGIIRKLMNAIKAPASVEIKLEYTPSWQERARELTTSENATKIAHEIADSQIPIAEKMDAFDTLYVGISGSNNMSYTERSRALSERIIASERAQAQAGNITWAEYEAYAREERRLCSERIAYQRSIGLK